MPMKTFEAKIKELNNLYLHLSENDSLINQSVIIQLVDIISSLQASFSHDDNSTPAILDLLETTKDVLLNYEAHNVSFLQHEVLSENIKAIIDESKVVLTSEKLETSEIEDELTNIKNELQELRDLLDSLRSSSSQHPPEEITDSLPEKEQPITTKDDLGSETPEDSLVDNDRALITEPISKPEQHAEIDAEADIDSPEGNGTILTETTIRRLSESSQQVRESKKVLGDMITIIEYAEEKTAAQIRKMREEKLAREKNLEQPEEEQLAPSEETLSLPAIHPSDQEPPHTQEKESPGDTLVKPSEILKRQQSKSKEGVFPGSDPYMQLLTLEAEKYRLDKELEKNETDFQEGLKKKSDYEITIQKINQDLKVIKEKINALRKALTS